MSRTREETNVPISHTTSTSLNINKTNWIESMISELKMQKPMALPLIAMNMTWVAKLAISTAFLGRLGSRQLAGGALGLTFANVTGFSVLTGLCSAMEPICGQAYGAKNYKLLHKTLLMAILLLLLTTLPIGLLWLYVEKVLVVFGQDKEFTALAKTYVFYLLPDLIAISVLSPLKAYLSSQGVTFPIMLVSLLSLAVHFPVTLFLSKAKGIIGVSMAVWLNDAMFAVLLGIYVLVRENGSDGKWKEGGWFDQTLQDWVRLVKLSGPCCLTTCFEWWCYEILFLLTGRLHNAEQQLGVLAIVMNFDYLLYGVMLSLATCASTRVSNELGANRVVEAYKAAYLSLFVSFLSGCVGGLLVIGARGFWGNLLSHDAGVVKGVKKMMLLIAILEVMNFPLVVCGGIVRGTARPALAMYANLGGFYFLALPLGIVFAFKVGLGLVGLLMGFLVGIFVCLALLLVLTLRIDWIKEGAKAQKLACHIEEDKEDAIIYHKDIKMVDTA